MSRTSLLLPAALAVLFAPSASAQTATVRVENPTDTVRADEVVSVRWDALARRVPGLAADRVRVTDADGTEIPTQTFDADADGTPDDLLLQVSLWPGQSRDLRVSANPSTTPAGRANAHHDARRDDVAWENDRVAFRTYGAGLAALESLVSSGFDVWTKRTSALVAADWYAADDYHTDRGQGADFFSVGTSLGAGGTALWDGESLWRASNFTSHRIVADGPLRAVIETVHPVEIDGLAIETDGGPLTETRRITIDAGRPGFRLESTFVSEDPEALRVATGIVDRAGTVTSTGDTQGWAWTSTWGPVNPAKGGHGDLGVAVLTRADRLAEAAHAAGHSLLIVTPPKSGTLVTHVVSAWTASGDVDDAADWWALLDAEAQRLAHPIRTSVVADPLDAQTALDAAADRLRPFLPRPVVADQIPRSMHSDGTLDASESREWTSGFYPGVLWLLYDYTRDDAFADAARKWTTLVEPEKTNGKTHDMGFKVYSSVGAAQRLAETAGDRGVIIEAADTLMTRFDPAVGAIRSWDWGQWDFPVIIDNMMNLELLYAASKLTGDDRYADAATQHARTTLANHFRDDASSVHVVEYAPDGAVEYRQTWQGASDESAWSRGQGWALYGYAMAYRESGEPEFLAQAQRVADFVLENPRQPGDGVPYWDYDAPAIPDEPRDASAAAVIASGLYELATMVPGQRDRYVAAADHMMAALSQDYLAPDSLDQPFVLDHSVGSVPGRFEVDVPIVYGDYYYVEALLRRLRLTDRPTLGTR